MIVILAIFNKTILYAINYKKMSRTMSCTCGLGLIQVLTWYISFKVLTNVVRKST